MRGHLLTAAVAATLVTTPALAARPKPCATVVDENLPGEPSSLDIRRVDVTPGTRTVAIRLTVDAMDAGEPTRLLGHRWAVTVVLAGRAHEVVYQRPPGLADTYRASSSGERLRSVAVSRTGITWTLDASPSTLRGKKAVSCAARATTQVAVLTADEAR